MGRHRGEAPIVIGSGSSIAILQERFKQLERVREKREEKELLLLFCGQADKTNMSPCPVDKTLFQPPKIQQQQHHQLKPVTEVRDPLSLDLQCLEKFKHDDNVGEMKNMSLASPDWSTIGLSKFAGNHESSEVDTTLHL